MRANVRAIDGILADGSRARFGELAEIGGKDGPTAELTERLLALGRREAAEIAARFPKLRRRVGGYNIDALTSSAKTGNA